ncbi:MAG: hypothetical protein ACKO9Q_14020 [Pirellula sp.]
MRNFDEIVDVEATAKVAGKELEQEQSDRISGKVALIAFSLILLMGLVAILSIGLKFQGIMQSLNASRSAWGRASGELVKRFGEAEQFLSSVDYLGNSPTLTDWKYYYAKFGESQQFDRQVEPAQKLESMLEALLSQQSLPPTAPFGHLKPGKDLLDLLDKEKSRKDSEMSFLGSWTKAILRLKTPPYFESVSR